MSVHLLRGPSGSGKTARLIERCQLHLSNSSQRLLWLAPTDRHVDQIKLQLGKPLGIEVLTFPRMAGRQLAEHEFGQQLPEIHQRLLLESVLDELLAKGKLSIARSASLARGVTDLFFQFVSELKGVSVSPAEFVEYARQRSRSGSDLMPIDADVALVYASYQQLLDRHEWLDREGIYRRAVAKLRIRQASYPTVCVDGFTAFTPAQLEMLKSLASRANEMWITLPAGRAGESNSGEMLTPIELTASNLFTAFRGVLEEEFVEAQADNRPAGIAYVSQALFCSEFPQAKVATGVTCIEGPGLVGEVRLIARAVKQVILDGAAPDSIVVSARDSSKYVTLIREVFEEYGIPLIIDDDATLMRYPIIVSLLKWSRLAEEGWPFAGTAALLRSGFFRPGWTELTNEGDLAFDAEMLLRAMGEPRGREHFLAVAQRWANEPQPLLEDEEAAEALRRRNHELAKRCLPVLEKLLSAWDDAPRQADFATHVAWLRQFADRMGISAIADANDAVALKQFWEAISAWAARESTYRDRSEIPSAEFFARIELLAFRMPLAGVECETVGVRVVPAQLAVGLTYEHLFLLGLGERGFPNLGSGPNLYDDESRREFRTLGLDLEVASDRLPEEMLTFYRLVARANTSITLSYAAVDEKGQEQLRGSFLQAVRNLFDDDALLTIRRTMRIEGFLSDRPLSPAEYRVQYAKAGGEAGSLSADTLQNLLANQTMVRQRIREKDFGPFDGILSNKTVVQQLQSEWGPNRTLSPTSLENYVACPFKFFIGNVLGICDIDEPNEAFEYTLRGAAFHRAVTRYLRNHSAGCPHQPDDLARELVAAVGEYANRASSPTVKTIWKLEGQRLSRTANKFLKHCDLYQKMWSEVGTLIPREFELGFGPRTGVESVVVRNDADEVRFAGRIDRVDVVELKDGSLGFVIVDYKTGRGQNYSPRAVTQGEQLQLSIYALAVEQWLGTRGQARPLGLVYWLPMDKGPKLAAPGKVSNWLSTDDWPIFRERLEAWLGSLARQIRTGKYPLAPRSEHCTATCSFNKTCRIAASRHVGKIWDLELPLLTGNDHEIAE